MRIIVSRPDPGRLPGIPLPVFVRSVGYNEAPPGWEECEESRRKNFVQIFWSIQGVGEFRFRDRTVLLHPNEAIYRLPGEEHVHRSADERIPWHYFWFTFDGPRSKEFLLSYGYEQRAYHAGACPAHLFSELKTLVTRCTPYAQRHAISVAAEILALFGSETGAAEHDIVKRFLSMIEENYADSAFSIDAAAAEMGMHRTTLYRIVTRELDCPPKRYLQRFRLQKALSLLVETEKTVKQIAAETGFNKVDHFCALVSAETGYTPLKYRKNTMVDSI